MIIGEIIYDILQDKELSGDSTKWANWMAQFTLTTCLFCIKKHGSIVDISVLKNKTQVFAHEKCKCVYVAMRTRQAGSATNHGADGADIHLLYFNTLPDYYVTKENARAAGWISWLGNLDNVLPRKMIGGNVYKNREGKLPKQPGRIWYEADINYTGGFRTHDRILYSNDGLIVVTYDHYQTFSEITN